MFRSTIRQAILLGFAVAGLFAHTLYLGQRAATTPDLPLSSSFDWYMLAAYILVVVYLYLRHYHHQQSLGIFFLPVVLVLIAVATFHADPRPFPQETAQQVWGVVHGMFLLAGTIAVVIGFVAGLMYLVQAYRLKHKMLPSQSFRLPSLEWLQKVNERAIIVSMLMLLVGFLSGVILNAVSHHRQYEARLPWNDPVVWTSAAMLGWLIAATVFNALYKPARVGRKVAYLTVASFIFLAIALGVKLFVDTEHRGSKAGTASAASARVAPDRPAPETASASNPPLRPAGTGA